VTSDASLIMQGLKLWMLAMTSVSSKLMLCLVVVECSNDGGEPLQIDPEDGNCSVC
jgi:hypothetical protein